MKSVCEQHEIRFRKYFFKKRICDTTITNIWFCLMVATISFYCLCYVSLMLHLYYVLYIFMFFIFCLTLDKDFNNNKKKKGRCLWQGNKLTQSFFFTFLYLPKLQKVVKNNQKSVKVPTHNNKIFLFHVPGT